MNYQKIGNVIYTMRREQGLTQKQLGDRIGVSDKAISKWESGRGCPDVSLLKLLSEILGIQVEKILAGEVEQNEKEVGNMRNVKFYVCPICGNVLTTTGASEVSCCGRKLTALIPESADDAHKIKMEQIENDYYITFNHEMMKEHHLSFFAVVGIDRVLLVKLYPEQSGELRIPYIPRAKIYSYCTKDGLWLHE